ncbi:hypothetical protein [Pseudoalteromonas luteoviolacea]|uniref:Lipoprotein n=1 Tax=Pseudoalteromonas luteoviolacea DSM 6061 TaxID=1365250 RepID=A0A166VCG8_9GAMM|nr:hypothetical protein [Pseudoalteromonas luteoviolacea]KZN32484.1 hypothetical protein N475_22650 [Pseudoalteromonas luteoviolacea DSM 6061]MBE0386000.1 hypothetical protein [Pseudoalteromonas luteoviolacea DSM 6061]
MKSYIPVIMASLMVGCSSSDSDENVQQTTSTEQESPQQSPNDNSSSGDNSQDNGSNNDSSGEQGDSQGPVTVDRGLFFPKSMVVASPFGDSSDEQERIYMSRGPASPTYFWATRRIDALLDGETPLLDVFRVRSFYRNSTNADCFGPQVSYQGHPGSADPATDSGTLPSGDLGLWLASDSDGNACAVAQTNALLDGTKERSRMALMTLASMVSAAIDDGSGLPEDGASIDLTTQMNSKGLASVNFSAASISLSAGIWQYSVTLEYTVGSSTYDIDLSMTHTPGGDRTNYTGLLNYSVEGEVGVSGIELPGGNCSQNQRTLVGSLAYERTEQQMSLQARTATLCGHTVSGAFNSDQQVDVKNKYHSIDNPDGWSENFAIFGANFDLTSLAGDYAYVWQAGVNDSHSRILNIGFNDASLENGEAHFGYGTDIDETNGLIQGFICNWAGPGNDHTLQAYTQRQFFEYDTSTSTYLGTEHRANIEYAPTNSCNYDGTGSFVFDIDVSGVLGDISQEDATIPFSNDLWAPTDPTLTVAESILARGLEVPDIPFTWPVDE